MKDKRINKNKVITFRLNANEYGKLEQKWKNTTYRKLSEFIRGKLLDQKIVTVYRNRSLDDFMNEMILLRKELNAIGNNFNQAIHKLHMSDTDQEIKIWLHLLVKDRIQLLQHTDKIKEKINSIADIWLQ